MLIQNTNKDLRKKLLEAVEDIYIRDLREKYFGYGNLTCLKVINNLKANYYRITPADLKLNTVRMNAPHNINKLFEFIIKKFETAVNSVDTGKILYSPEQVMTKEYDLIFATG